MIENKTDIGRSSAIPKEGSSTKKEPRFPRMGEARLGKNNESSPVGL